ncbi:hypothetical protein ACLOJK_028597 [Asimina triloba]
MRLLIGAKAADLGFSTSPLPCCWTLSRKKPLSLGCRNSLLDLPKLSSITAGNSTKDADDFEGRLGFQISTADHE